MKIQILFLIANLLLLSCTQNVYYELKKDDNGQLVFREGPEEEFRPIKSGNIPFVDDVSDISYMKITKGYFTITKQIIHSETIEDEKSFDTVSGVLNDSNFSSDRANGFIRLIEKNPNQEILMQVVSAIDEISFSSDQKRVLQEVIKISKNSDILKAVAEAINSVEFSIDREELKDLLIEKSLSH